jgi:hypothetical protein
MVAYYDSINYKIEIDGKENIFLKFITGIVKNGISVKVNSTQYHIRGIYSHTHGLSGQRNAVRHYHAYCRRNGGNNWELYDNQRTKSIPVNSNTKVPCELLMYSI